MTKQDAREQMKLLRKNLSVLERHRKDRAIAKRLLEFLENRQETWFFPFVSYGTEVDTRGLIQQVLESGRFHVAVPKVVGEDMDFYEISSLAELTPGYHGILEPAGKKPIQPENGIMLLPGLAFDRKKHRVGYGGGYYDRYLKTCNEQNWITIALAYDFQIVDKIETAEFDKKPQWIITDTEFF